MRRDFKLYLQDIIQTAQSVSEALAGINVDEYAGNRLLQAAVERYIEIIGEAAKRVPAELKQKHAADWKLAARMRDVLAHDYPSVVARVVWETAMTDVPRLAQIARRILAAEQLDN